MADVILEADIAYYVVAVGAADVAGEVGEADDADGAADEHVEAQALLLQVVSVLLLELWTRNADEHSAQDQHHLLKHPRER